MTPQPRRYTKNIATLERFEREVSGYLFFAHVYPYIPKLFSSGNTHKGYFIDYEHLSNGKRTLVGAHLAQNKKINLQRMFSSFAKIANRSVSMRLGEGGSKVYYVNRIERLNTAWLREVYNDFTIQYENVTINSQNVRINPNLLNDIQHKIAELQFGPAVPTHGDLHELNMYTDGYLIDFEAAGWSHVVADIATFLEHTLFVGNYFGLRYANWSSDVDKVMMHDQPQQLVLNPDSTVSINITSNRIDAAQQFLTHYVSKLNFLEDANYEQISWAIAHRLLTVFDLTVMSEQDRRLAYIIANYFADSSQTFTSKLLTFDLAINFKRSDLQPLTLASSV